MKVKAVCISYYERDKFQVRVMNYDSLEFDDDNTLSITLNNELMFFTGVIRISCAWVE